MYSFEAESMTSFSNSTSQATGGLFGTIQPQSNAAQPQAGSGRSLFGTAPLAPAPGVPASINTIGGSFGTTSNSVMPQAGTESSFGGVGPSSTASPQAGMLFSSSSQGSAQPPPTGFWFDNHTGNFAASINNAPPSSLGSFNFGLLSRPNANPPTNHQGPMSNSEIRTALRAIVAPFSWGATHTTTTTAATATVTAADAAAATIPPPANTDATTAAIPPAAESAPTSTSKAKDVEEGEKGMRKYRLADNYVAGDVTLVSADQVEFKVKASKLEYHS
jgi:hypothetical protein